MANREIKFRAWTKNHWINKEMVYDWQDMTYIESVGFNPAEIPVMQYTGLKDKNGKEIYEGDIVKWVDKYKMSAKSGISEIIWDVTGFNIRGSRMGYEGEELISWDNLEVIGNIHENPELIK